MQSELVYCACCDEPRALTRDGRGRAIAACCAQCSSRQWSRRPRAEAEAFVHAALDLPRLIAHQLLRLFGRAADRAGGVDDLAQEGMIGLIKASRWARTIESIDHFRAIANKIVKREMLALLKRDMRQQGKTLAPFDDDDVPIADAVDRIQSSCDQHDVRVAMSKLPKRMVDVLERRFIDGLQLGDIASRIGASYTATRHAVQDAVVSFAGAMGIDAPAHVLEKVERREDCRKAYRDSSNEKRLAERDRRINALIAAHGLDRHDLILAAEAARIAGLPDMTLSRWISSGKIQAYGGAHNRIVRRSQVIAALEAMPPKRRRAIPAELRMPATALIEQRKRKLTLPRL